MDPIPHLGNPEDQSLKEYVVTLKSLDDANDFYNDMETPGGSLYIPKRVVECSNRRPVSRNTHYMLTYDEAALIKKDPRVLDVTLNPSDLGLIKGTFGFVQTSSNFNKSVDSSSVDINWGLLRCLRETDIANWGTTGTINQFGTIASSLSGKNVDVVIMDDGAPFPTVLEYQQNPDGTGYSRMVEYNWFQHNPVVTGQPAGNYDYPGERLQEHGGHTTGTVAGNTQGWARDANIYNLTYYDSIDYVREFHKNKPVNPLTGVKNPTVMNNSWGYRGYSLTTAYISKLTIRGIDYFPISGSNGSYVWDSNVIQNIARLNIGGAFPARDTPTDIDMIDAMAEGVIIVASAGNSYFYEDKPGGLDYDNTMVYNGSTLYIHRGSSPGAAWGDSENTRIICVGAIGQHNEPPGNSIYDSSSIEVGDYKSEFSNYGPRVDIFAPGSGIQSVWSAGSSLYDNTNTPDPRVAALGLTDTVNNNFKKCPGTSMSGPQVTGVLACIAEKYPRMTQADAREWLRKMCPETILSTNGGAQDSKDAGFTFNADSCKKMLILKDTRINPIDVGGYSPVPVPAANNFYRPSSGAVYPRRRDHIRTKNTANVFTLAANTSSATNGQTVTFTATTTNLPNGTSLPYIITAKPVNGSQSLITTSFVGAYNADSPVSGVTINTQPNTSSRIVTTGALTGTSETITNNIIGPASLTASTAPTNGNNDDGYWAVNLPFSILYLNQSYNTVYIGTNTYVTFGSGSTEWAQLSGSNPPFPKLMLTAADNSCQRIYYGVEGTAPNRTYRIRYEGHSNYTGGVLGNPTIVYELTFYEAVPAQIDIHFGVNDEWFVSAGATYPFTYEDIGVPLTGTMTVSNGSASLSVPITTTEVYDLTLRLGVYPSPSTTVRIN